MFGLQFHPEVTHSVHGKEILRNFGLFCKAPMDWTMSNLADIFIAHVRELVGPEGKVIGAVSGGVDSSVAAVLLHRAIGMYFNNDDCV
jgi:GMP synthase (glutamine-hydrolysing)